MNKNYLIIGGVIVLFVLLLIFRGDKQTVQNQEEVKTGVNNQNTETATNQTKVTETTAPKTSSKNTGRVVFTITDEAVSLDSLQSILLTINNVSVNGQKGWVNILNAPKEFDLLDLYRNTRTQIFSDLNLETGTYNQIRISIGKVTVIPKGGVNGVVAKLPSGEIRFNTKIVVESGKTSAISLDFISSKAIHRSTDGGYMFFPVIKMDAYRQISKVQTLGNNTQLIGGLSDFSRTLGVDENGEMKNDFNFNGYSKIKYIGKTIHVIPVEEKSEDIKSSAENAVSTSISSGYITEALSVQTIMKDGKRVWQVVGKKGSAVVKIYLDIVSGAVISTE